MLLSARNRQPVYGTPLCPIFKSPDQQADEQAERDRQMIEALEALMVDADERAIRT